MTYINSFIDGPQDCTPERLRIYADQVRYAGREHAAKVIEWCADLLSVRGGWHPIATAPKMAKNAPAPEVLLYFPAIFRERPGYVLREIMKVERWNCWGPRQPTHWMPLPDPPKEQNDG